MQPERISISEKPLIDIVLSGDPDVNEGLLWMARLIQYKKYFEQQKELVDLKSNELIALKQQYEELKSALDMAKISMEIATSEKDRLDEKCKRHEECNKTLQMDCDDKEREIEVLKEKLQQVLEENEALRKRLQETPLHQVPDTPLPGELALPKAMLCWRKLMAAGVVDANYRLTERYNSRQMAAFIAECFSYLMPLKRKWVAFEELWGIKNLRQEAQRMPKEGPAYAVVVREALGC